MSILDRIPRRLERDTSDYLQIRISPEMKRKVFALAKVHKVKASEIVRAGLTQFIEEESRAQRDGSFKLGRTPNLDPFTADNKSAWK